MSLTGEDDPLLADDEIEEANALGLLAMSNRQLVRLVLHEIERASQAENELDRVREQKSDAGLLARAEDAEKALAVLNTRLGEAQSVTLFPAGSEDEIARRVASLQRAVPTPPGYVLVPEEPTQGICTAMSEVARPGYRYAAMYRAAIAESAKVKT